MPELTFKATLDAYTDWLTSDRGAVAMGECLAEYYPESEGCDVEFTISTSPLPGGRRMTCVDAPVDWAFADADRDAEPIYFVNAFRAYLQELGIIHPDNPYDCNDFYILVRCI